MKRSAWLDKKGLDMNIEDLIENYSDSAQKQSRAIFSSIFIIGNKLQTIFDNNIPEISLKQFMLLSMIRQSEIPLTLTQLGNLLGCSRQNIKKIAESLMKKGYITFVKSSQDSRATCIRITQKANDFYENDFAKYQKDLKYLFDVYSSQEIEALFTLLSKMYSGIENLCKCQSENVQIG